MEAGLDSPSLPMDVADINVCLLSAKKKSASSPSLRQLDQMSLCSFPSSVSVTESLSELAGTSEECQIGELRRGRSRKRTRELDTMSVQDFKPSKGPSSKKRRPLSKVTSIANKIMDSPLKRSLKRSLSFSKEPPPASPASKYRLPPGTPKLSKSHENARRKADLNNPTLRLGGYGFTKKKSTVRSRLPENWVGLEGVANLLEHFTKEDIKRQEAIYAIYRTEIEIVEDLKMVINIFYHPLLRLNLVTEEEHCKIFGNIQTILSLHEDLVSRLEVLRCNSDCIDAIGETVMEWIANLSPYTEYCANLAIAKQVLEVKRQDHSFEDFLQRCLDSEFSRKLDLWTFLDSPRSRIMKYPILLKEVKKKTPAGHPDLELLDEAMSSLDVLIKEIDRWTGMAKCRDIISRLEYLHDDQKCPEIEDSEFILCSGILRTKHNTKVHVFLFNKAIVLTRPSSRTGTLLYQVYREPIPVSSLVVEDLGDGSSEVGGSSFKGHKSKTSNSSSGLKNLFRVSCSDSSRNCHAHILQANGDYDKKVWLDAFRTSTDIRLVVPEGTVV